MAVLCSGPLPSVCFILTLLWDTLTSVPGTTHFLSDLLSKIGAPKSLMQLRSPLRRGLTGPKTQDQTKISALVSSYIWAFVPYLFSPSLGYSSLLISILMFSLCLLSVLLSKPPLDPNRIFHKALGMTLTYNSSICSWYSYKKTFQMPWRSPGCSGPFCLSP